MKKITLLIYALTAFLFLSLSQKTNAQLQNTNWYFGSETGLDFSDGTQDPTIITNSLMDTDGGSASISDDLGNLLFYTNGINVWNNLHQIMPNGSGLLGGANISQSVIIVPDPSDTNKYYVFTNQGDSMEASGLYYSIIDMTLDNGSGDVVISDKNTDLLEYASEKLTAVYNVNDDSYWVVLFAPDDNPMKSDTFYIYKVDQFGISFDHKTTFTFPFPSSGADLNKGGQMKISPDGQSLALIHNLVEPDGNGGFINAQSIFTLDFDMPTGTVSSLNSSIILTDNLYSYGLEFSPDSNLLYASTTNRFSDEGFFGRIHQIQYRNSGVITSDVIFEGF